MDMDKLATERKLDIEKTIKVLSSMHKTSDTELRDALEIAIPILESELTDRWVPVVGR